MLTYRECRQAMHAAERHASNVRRGADYGPRQLGRAIAEAEEAYFMTPEPNVARRLQVAIDHLGDL